MRLRTDNPFPWTSVVKFENSSSDESISGKGTEFLSDKLCNTAQALMISDAVVGA